MVVGIINRGRVASAQNTNRVPQNNSVHPIAVGIHKGFVDDNVVFLPGTGVGFSNFGAIEFVARVECEPVEFFAICDDVTTVFVCGWLLGFGVPMRVKVEIMAVVGRLRKTRYVVGIGELVKPTCKNEAFTGWFF